MTIVLSSKWSRHEGGTKYYAVYQIRAKGTDRAVLVKTHGSFKLMVPLPREIPASRCKTEWGSSIFEFDAAIRAKSQRGYTDWNETADNKPMDLRTLVEIFRENDAKAIINYLETGDTVQDNADLVEEDATFATAPAYASVENESWGSW